MLPQQLSQSVRRQQTRASNKSSIKCVLQSSKVGNLAETVLDETVWSRQLPHQIICMILACLPFSSFFRLQCVCKKWNLIGQDPIFIDAYTRVSTQVAYLFLASRDGMYWIYEEGFNSWKSIPPSFFCPKHLEGTWSPVAAVGTRLILTKSSGRDRIMLAKTSGDYADRNYSLVVYNPLSGTHQTLPPMVAVHPAGDRGITDSIRYTAEMLSTICVKDMYVEPLENYYKFLVMDKTSNVTDDSDGEEERLRFQDYSTIHVQLYDSRTSEWEVKEIPDFLDEFDVLGVALFGEALLYLTVVSTLDPFRDYAIVNDLVISELTHDLVGNDTYEWDSDGEIAQYHFPKRDRELKLVTAHMFVARGRLLLAVAVPFERAQNEIVPKWKSIIIWEMVGHKMTRVAEIDLKKLGPRPCRRRMSHYDLGAFLLSKGDSLYFCSDSEDLFGIIDVVTKTWRLLPPFPGKEPSTIEGKFEPFLYQPGFDLAA